MRIYYLGHSAIKIKTKRGAVVVVNPFSEEAVGFSMKNIEVQIVACSHKDEGHSSLSSIKNSDYFLIEGPGEYELSGIFIKGVETFHDGEEDKSRDKNTIFVIETEGVRVCHLGDVCCNLSEKQVDQINGIDILVIPLNGDTVRDAESAIKIINQIEPSIVIPLYLNAGRYKDERQKNLALLSDFLRKIGGKIREEERLVVSKSGLPEETEVVVLKKI